MSPSARVFADQRPIPFTCQTITETHTTVKQQLTIYSASPNYENAKAVKQAHALSDIETLIQTGYWIGDDTNG